MSIETVLGIAWLLGGAFGLYQLWEISDLLRAISEDHSQINEELQTIRNKLP